MKMLKIPVKAISLKVLTVSLFFIGISIPVANANNAVNELHDNSEYVFRFVVPISMKFVQKMKQEGPGKGLEEFIVFCQVKNQHGHSGGSGKTEIDLSNPGSSVIVDIKEMHKGSEPEDMTSYSCNFGGYGAGGDLALGEGWFYSLGYMIESESVFKVSGSLN